jgi:hypothetical protein
LRDSRIPTDQTALLDYQVVPVTGAGTPATDNNAVRNGGAYEMTVQTPMFGGQDITFDAGFVLRIKIGLRVFSDLNKNGIREAGDNGISEVQVVLTDAAFNPIGNPLVTSPLGEYRFDSFNYDIRPGVTYNIVVGVPNGYEPTLDNRGGDDTLDSDGVYDAGRGALVASFTPPAYGYVNETIDFGFAPVFRIGDFVWNDNASPAGNGRQDLDEPGIDGVIVRLFSVLANGNPDQEVGRVTTSNGGRYEFNSFVHNLSPNTAYVLQVAVPSGFQPTAANAATASDDSDGVPLLANPQIVQVNITSPTYGANDPDYDFGFVETCDISGIAWRDDNGDGQQQTPTQSGAEPFVNGLAVTLREVGVPANDVVTNTDQQGRFTFSCYRDSIEPGKQYELIVQRTPDLKETTPGVPPEPTDSDGVYSVPRDRIIISLVGPPYGTQSDDNDFGLIRVIRIGDYVWIDAEQPGAVAGHGTQESGELPVINATVLLYDGTSSSSPVASTKTDDTGFYELSSFHYDIRPGQQYVVAISLADTALTTPVGNTRPLTPTTPLVGSDRADDSNGN